MTDQDREKKAEAIFEAMMNLPTQDRPAAIAAACDGDVELAARVGALLAGARAAEGFLSDPTMDSAPVTEKPGTIIGRYKLLQQIGEGGFGVVFMAEQEKPVRRTVALKVIKLGMDTREVVARFEAERQALAMMDHPNIAKVLDAGSTDTGRPYFVMELVRGSPLTEYCDKRKLVTTERVALLAQVCRAVQHAHSKGIIHRDLKPSNVLVTVADDKPIPKVIDFGIAKATQSKLTDRTLFTAFRQMIGTPQYMSPEQADSDGVDVDTRTDVYSLGVLLYELLVGTTPFDAKSLRSAALEEMRRIIRDFEPPRPSTRLLTMAGETMTAVASARGTEPKRLGQIVHGELDWIVMKALEKDRARRYDTAAAFADDLNRYLAGEAVLAGPVSGMYRLKKTLRRYRTAVAVGSAIAAVLLLGIVGTTVGLVSATHQRNRAEQKQMEADQQKTAAIASERKAIVSESEAQREKVLAEAEKKEALAQKAQTKATLDFLTNDILAKAAPSNAKDDKVSKVLVDALITPALQTIDQRFKDQPLVRASVQMTLGITLNDLGRFDLALPQAKAAWDGRRTVLGDDHPDTLDAKIVYGITLSGLGRYGEAAELYKQALDRCRSVLGENDPKTINAMINYGSALSYLGRFPEAVDIEKQAWDLSRRVLGKDHPSTLEAMMNYGDALGGSGRYAEAADVFKQALDLSRRVLGDDHPVVLLAMTNYGNALIGSGRGDAEAANVFKQAWDRDRRVLGDNHPDTLQAMSNYGDSLNYLGRNVEATEISKQALDLFRKVLGDDHPKTLRAMKTYADALSCSEHFGEAAELYRQTLDLSRRVRGDNDPETIQAVTSYGICLYHLARYTDAAERLKQAWDQAHRVLGDDHPATLEAMLYYGYALRKLNQNSAAADVAKQLWDRDRKTLGDDDADTITAMVSYCDALNAMGPAAGAEASLQQAVDTLRRVRPDDPNRAVTLCALGQCLIAQQKWSKAEAVLRESLVWSKAHLASAVPDSLRLLNDCLKAQGKPVEATTAPTTRAATGPTTKPMRP